MFAKELNLVKAAEARADATLKKARSDAREMMEKAENDAAVTIEKAEEEAESIYKTLIAKGEEEAKKEYDAAMAEAKRQQSVIAQRAEPNFPEAVAYVTERIVNTSVDS
jgi:vacuolar-type H+-ATPase subunit H